MTREPHRLRSRYSAHPELRSVVPPDSSWSAIAGIEACRCDEVSLCGRAQLTKRNSFAQNVVTLRQCRQTHSPGNYKHLRAAIEKKMWRAAVFQRCSLSSLVCNRPISANGSGRIRLRETPTIVCSGRAAAQISAAGRGRRSARSRPRMTGPGPVPRSAVAARSGWASK